MVMTRPQGWSVGKYVWRQHSRRTTDGGVDVLYRFRAGVPKDTTDKARNNRFLETVGGWGGGGVGGGKAGELRSTGR